jgi:hypothetical protein
MPTGPTPPFVVNNFDDYFAHAVRISGWLLGIWAAITGKIQGPELVGLVIAFVGFEFVARFRDGKLKQLEKDED